MAEKEDADGRGLFGQVSNLTAGLSRNALNSLAGRVGGMSLKIGSSLILNHAQLMLLSREQRAWMERAGVAIKDARETAGMSVEGLADALDMKDKSLLEAMENGSATVSFEMIMRMTSLLARNDPIPFVISLVRGFNPGLWAVLEDWGFGNLPTMVERDRRWMNIYRGNEAARQLPEDEFNRVIDFCRSAFEMAMEFKASEESRAGGKES